MTNPGNHWLQAGNPGWHGFLEMTTRVSTSGYRPPHGPLRAAADDHPTPWAAGGQCISPPRLLQIPPQATMHCTRSSERLPRAAQDHLPGPPGLLEVTTPEHTGCFRQTGHHRITGSSLNGPRGLLEIPALDQTDSLRSPHRPARAAADHHTGSRGLLATEIIIRATEGCRRSPHWPLQDAGGDHP